MKEFIGGFLSQRAIDAELWCLLLLLVWTSCWTSSRWASDLRCHDHHDISNHWLIDWLFISLLRQSHLMLMWHQCNHWKGPTKCIIIQWHLIPHIPICCVFQEHFLHWTEYKLFPVDCCNKLSTLWIQCYKEVCNLNNYWVAHWMYFLVWYLLTITGFLWVL